MSQLVIEFPDGDENELSPALLNSRARSITVLKLKNVVVEDMSLLKFLVKYSETLRAVKLESVALIMTGAIHATFHARVARWTNIISYIREGMQLEQLDLISLGWHDRVHHLTIDQRLATPQAKYHLRRLGVDSSQQSRLLRTFFEARGNLAIKDGLEKMIDEVQKPKEDRLSATIKSEVDDSILAVKSEPIEEEVDSLLPVVKSEPIDEEGNDLMPVVKSIEEEIDHVMPVVKSEPIEEEVDSLLPAIKLEPIEDEADSLWRLEPIKEDVDMLWRVAKSALVRDGVDNLLQVVASA